MRIQSIEFKDLSRDAWDFGRVELGRVNLLVGPSGSGKTRFLNFLFNVACFLSGTKILSPVEWIFEFTGDAGRLRWEFQSDPDPGGIKPRVRIERITDITNPETPVVIINRTKERFEFNGVKLPKLSLDQSALTLLKEEEAIEPLYYLFSNTVKRSFSEASVGQLMAYSPLSRSLKDSLSPGKLPAAIYGEVGLSLRLYVLRECMRSKYDEIVGFYKSVFPFIESCDIVDASRIQINIQYPGEVPVFAVKERGVNTLLPLNELSSGMQKVLLIMADIILLRKGSTYLIDEYENSLGVNAIDFLPSFLNDNRGANQFLITTHHPYLINSMPVVNWCLFQRRGSSVTVIPGTALVEKYGKSSQQAFLKLINDPNYS